VIYMTTKSNALTLGTTITHLNEVFLCVLSLSKDGRELYK
jgi:hypothetical protein